MQACPSEKDVDSVAAMLNKRHSEFANPSRPYNTKAGAEAASGTPAGKKCFCEMLRTVGVVCCAGMHGLPTRAQEKPHHAANIMLQL